jgi:hypothetical protein
MISSTSMGSLSMGHLESLGVEIRVGDENVRANASAAEHFVFLVVT